VIWFARRQGPALWHLYVEIMGKYSNVILTDESEVIITAAHQVSQQSSVRSNGTALRTTTSLTGAIPTLSESQSAGKNG